MNFLLQILLKIGTIHDIIYNEIIILANREISFAGKIKAKQKIGGLKMENKTKDYYTVDIIQIIKTLWRRAWIVVLCGILAAVVGFSVSTFVITPKYSSSIMLYINNSSVSLGNNNFSISSSEISAAQSLVKTYGEILNNRTTLEKVIDKTGVSYTCEELGEMIDAFPSNNTEVMKVTVTTNDPYEAAKIANGIADVLTERVAEIIDGASMAVVDSAIPELDKVAPSTVMYTAVSLVLGVLVSVMAIVVVSLLDDTIHDEDYVVQNYDCPILARIPDLMSKEDSRYGYYRKKNNDKN